MRVSITPDHVVSEVEWVKSQAQQAMIPHVSDGLVPGVTGGGAVLYLTGLGVMIFFGVIMPAVWSRKTYRRKAALAVFDRLVQAVFDSLDRVLQLFHRLY